MLYFSAQNYETANKKSNAMLKFKDIFFKYDKIRTTSKQNNRLISLTGSWTVNFWIVLEVYPITNDL